MIVMPSNNNGAQIHYLAGRFEGMLGHLYSINGWANPHPWLPYALDNGAYSAFLKGKPFNMKEWRALCQKAKDSLTTPLWMLVPDVVGDKAATLYSWSNLADKCRKTYGWPLAFAAQDGMTPADVPGDADVVFLGGSTDWKRDNILRFCEALPRVHVGRINTYKWLRYCADAGAESCDGTGWMRGDQRQLDGLICFLEEEAGLRIKLQQETIW